ncbi:MAG: cation:proton antiporter [Bacteroidaceae bacterium]
MDFELLHFIGGQVFMDFMSTFYEKYQIGESFQAIISLVLIILVAFLLTRITKKLKLPNVTAYILSGVLIGPFVLNLVPTNITSEMTIVSDVGLGFIAFGIGRYFNLSTIVKNGGKAIVISVLEVLVSAVLIFIAMMLFKLPVGVCLIFASIGATTSAASTSMTIKQYNCKGKFVDYLIEIIALDNIIGLLAFSIISGVAFSLMGGGDNLSMFSMVWLPVLANIGVVVIGFVFGVLLAKVVITPTRSKDNRLILTVAAIMLLVGICGLAKLVDTTLSVSPLLCVMVFAATYINMTKDEELFNQVADFAAPILLIFFVLSGINFQMDQLATVGWVGVAYILVRIVAKYSGAFIGGLITKSNKSIKYLTGISMYPQAGVSVGLATLAGSMLYSIPTLSVDYASQINAVIVTAAIFFEIIGPGLARFSLKASGSLKEGAPGSTPMFETGSMLKDSPSIEDSVDYEKRMKKLQKIQISCDKANRFIHTKTYKDSHR